MAIDNGSLLEQSRLVLPHLFAQATSAGAWLPYRHMAYVSTIIAEEMWLAETTGIGARIVVSLPPRHGKSEFVSHRLPTWVLHNWPHRHVILTTYEADFAIHWGRKVRNTINESSDIGVTVSADSSAAQRWTTTKGGGMITAGVGGPITGRGGHLIVVDDPHKNWQESQSQTVREGIIDWFNSTLYTRAEPGASIIVLQTRWHEKDLAGYLVTEHQDKWTEIRLPAFAENNDPLGRKPGEPLCPERYDKAALERIRNAIRSVMWAALYQQRPAPAEGRIVKLEWWQYYSGPFPGGLIIQSWDTAFKKGEENAYTVGQTWKEGPRGFYLLDQIRQRLEYPDLKRAIKSAFNKWRPNAVLIEDKASGQSVVQELRRSTAMPVIPVKVGAGNDKEVRAKLISPLVEAGRVFLPENVPWLQDYLSEWMYFPGSEFSDQVDATSQALDYLSSRKGRIISGAKIFITRASEG